MLPKLDSVNQMLSLRGVNSMGRCLEFLTGNFSKIFPDKHQALNKNVRTAKRLHDFTAQITRPFLEYPARCHRWGCVVSST